MAGFRQCCHRRAEGIVVAGHELIEAQLAILSARLPAQAVDELTDGMRETYQARLALLGDGEAAAREAIVAFGDADEVTAAFSRDSPWRRMALVLLATGPVMAALWGASLGMLVAVASMTSLAPAGPIGAWLLPAALAASLFRITATLRALPAMRGR
jgi:hypothetical protein